MECTIWLKESSEPIEYKNIVNTYTKGDLFCVYIANEKIHKFPIDTISKIIEDYGTHTEGSIRNEDIPDKTITPPEIDIVLDTRKLY